MKYVRLFLFTFITLIFTISCGNKEAKNIISVKRASAEKLMDSFKKFENNFLLRSDLSDNGYEKIKFFLTDYDIQGSKAAEILQSTAPVINSIIENQIGMTSRFINDKQAKEFKFSYTFNNILKNEEKTDLINIVIGPKNIEAASPAVFNKVFSLPAKDLGKALALITPKEIPTNLNVDLTYNALKSLNSVRPDKASQKRYDKAQNILYKNPEITRNGNTYSIIFNNDDVIKSIRASINALKNDNRLKALWSIYKKLFEKEFKEIEEKFNTEIKDKIKESTFTEELTVKDNLVIKDIYTVIVGGKEIIKFEVGIKNYENPIDGITYAITITDPKAIDKNTTADMISCIFASKGTITDTLADIDYSASISIAVTPDTETPPLSGLDMHCYFYADTTKENDNFKIGMDVTSHRSFDSEKNTPLNFAIQALGSVAKAPDMITYKIDTVDMEMETPGIEKYAINLGTEASVIYSKNILDDINMPKETVNVFETKVNEWQTIKDEITANIAALSSLLNL